jgi:hypothetical protein
MADVSSYDRDDVKVKGVDSTNVDREITAVSDGSKYRLCVDTKISNQQTNLIFHSKYLRWDDMNASTGGVAREATISTAWTAVYLYSGTGFAHGFVLNLEDESKWDLRVVVDSQELFSASGISTADLKDDNIYDLDNPDVDDTSPIGIFLGDHGKIVWSGPGNRPVRFDSAFTIYVRRNDGGTKKFKAGLVSITKES